MTRKNGKQDNQKAPDPDTSKLGLLPFAVLVVQLNRLVDSRKYDDITITQVNEHIENRDVLRWLADTAKGDIDLSFLLGSDAHGDFDRMYSNFLQHMRQVYGGDERRKWGVQQLGICLLIAWTCEAMLQGGKGWQPDKESNMFRNF